MIVRDVMLTEVARLPSDATFADAARRLQELGWSELPLADDERLVGVVALGDVLRALLPDVDEFVRLGGSVRASFDAFLDMGSDLMDQPVARIVITDPIVIEPEAPLLRAATAMVSRHIHRMFVVDKGRLVGTIGRADVCVGALRPRD